MERVNGRIAEALENIISWTLVNERIPWSSAARLHPLVRKRSWRLRTPAIFSRAARGPADLGAAGARIALWLPAIRVWKALRGIDLLFVPVGSDAGALARGRWLARQLGIPYAVYAVDDSEVLSGDSPAFHEWVTRAARVFVITQGLGDAWKERHGISCAVLSLPYAVPECRTAVERTSEIVFLGSINELYAERLRCLHEVISQLNTAHGWNLTLRFTIARKDQILKLLGSAKNVSIKACEGGKPFQQLLAASLFCYAPYSFAGEVSRLISTSFPSKVLEYLAWAPCILCNGPGHSSLARMFAGHSIPELLTSSDKKSLAEVVERIVRERPDYSDRYREVLRQEHRYGRFLQQWEDAWI